ncbi:MULTISPECIES: MetQ/NlpA family ABC transporter substrate-binding protein [unclassified Campylobacter]|uniref:MetQ/NlpA family ABC transporter substrate-binding protein n=1 Tax=unclassified Campylobacter TaxID=2593542 RepID=UPI0022E9DF15|nr:MULTISPECIES: MetQ/NlpA family ABC transporter substrate-binding protein [unclassified Campylobacter]MDA3055881.1 MetQ/NlpA family ABC transporter substrate-binding protein [Campylobacter sp. CN_NA1]MDA3081940.1 MetQ/NlpA family ABC transporter substrate-binding protein [Campylobacter sp. CN_EL2]MDA3089458.1 MetQ/NlpA family ABC transporter substrate-binding protein [Campylobacter sp. CN_EL1]
MRKLILTALLGASLVSSALAESLVVGATPIPHAEILEIVKDDLKAKGFELEIKVFNDYVTPNKATDSGDLDANYFQHEPYLNEFNANNGTKVVKTIGVHLEPMGVYSKKIKAINELSDGAKVAVPNDPTNESRALDLLVSAGLIEVDTSVALRTPIDITKNPKNLQIIELESPALPRTLDDVEIAVINSNFAFNADLNPVKDSLVLESAEGNPYTNIVAVKEGNENAPKIKALKEALQSQKVKDFIAEQYKGAVISAF